MKADIEFLQSARSKAIIFDKERSMFWAKNKRGYTYLLSENIGLYDIEEAKEIASDSLNGEAYQHQIVLYPYVVSFMLNMPTNPELSGKGVLIFAQNLLSARDAMFMRYGSQWAFAYDLDDFMSDFDKYKILPEFKFAIVDVWASIDLK